VRRSPCTRGSVSASSDCRKARGWSFTYLSVHSGFAKNTIVEVESGRTEPRLNTIAALAGSFGKTLSELLRGL